MNTISRIAAFTLSIAAASTAFAGDVGPRLSEFESHPVASTPSTLTRADVRAATIQALAEGTVRASEFEVNLLPSKPSSLTREEVRAETLRAIASGELRALNDEQSPFARHYRATPAKAVDAKMAAV